MAQRPVVPPFGSLAGPLGNRIDPVLGYGSLDTGVGETMSLPAGSQGPATRMAGENIQLVKDEAVRAAIDDLSNDFATFVSQQKQMLMDFKTSMNEVKATLSELTRIAKATAMGGGAAGASGGTYSAGRGNPTAGYTTGQTILSAAQDHLSNVILNAQQAANGTWHVPGFGGAIPMPPVPGGTNLPVPRPSNLPMPMPPGHSGTVAGTPGGGGGGGVGIGPLPPFGGGGGGKAGLGSRLTPQMTLQSLGGLRKAYDFYINQTAKNRAYQQVLGGGNMSQVAVRAGEKGFRYSHWGLGAGDDAQMYQDAVDLGLRDNETGVGGVFGGLFHGAWSGQAAGSAVAGHASATQAADTAYDLKKGAGIDTKEFFSTYEIALKNGASGLGQVAVSLRDVTDAAREFGVNAVMVRKNFQQMFGATTQSGFRSGAAGLADVLTQQVTSGGMTMSDVNAAGMVSDQMTYRYSAASGMTHGQFLAASASNPSVAAGAISRNGDQMMTTFLGPAKDYIVQRVQQLNAQGADVSKNEALKNQIASEVQQKFGGTLDPSVLAQQLNQQMGLNLTADNAVYYCVNWLAGNNPSAIAQQVQAKSGLQNGTHSAKGQGGLHGAADDLIDSVPGVGLLHQFGAPSGAEKQYQKLTQQGESDGYMKGKHSPVVDALLKNTNHGKDGMIAVNTLSGKRVMSVADALKYFPAEVAAGKVSMVGGSHNGEVISQVTGGLADSSTATSDEAKNELNNNLISKKGQDYDSYLKKHPQKDQSSKVTVDLSPAARSLLQLIPGNAAAASGMPLSPGS